MIKILSAKEFLNKKQNVLSQDVSQETVLLDRVKVIQDDVLKNKDEALLRLTQQFDKVQKPTLFVTESDTEKALSQVSKPFLTALKKAYSNIHKYHSKQKPKNWSQTLKNGVQWGLRYTPLNRVGLYTPGGRAIYPSTVLMNAIPAQIAGVKDLVITTPPQPDGSVPAAILAAAHLCGVKTILKVGGAQAIFALAYGTEKIKKVDKIVGPGNSYVTLAKQMVYGTVDIDKPAGPSEVLVILDDAKYATFAASELLAQLEHDPQASAFAISTSKEALTELQKALKTLFKACKRQEILTKSLENSALIQVASQKELFETANAIASEHVVLLVDNPDSFLPYLEHGSSLFLGPYTPVALGDYFAGPNHVLPTAGAARFASPLGVLDFMKYASTLKYPKNALMSAAPHLKVLTDTEQLDAHYLSVSTRLK